jgi:PKD repeat protein
MLRRLALALLTLFISAPLCFAEAVLPPDIVPVISADDSIEVNRSVIFDASQTTASYDGTLIFEWAFGDGNRQEGAEVVHSYAKTGEYTVHLLVRNERGLTAELDYPVFVYSRSFMLVTNVLKEGEKLTALVEAARSEDVYIEFLPIETSGSLFLEEEELRRQLLEHSDELEAAQDLVIYTYGSSGLTVLSQLIHNLNRSDLFAGKNIYFLSEYSISSMNTLARGVYGSIQPAQIILTRSEALWPLLESADPTAFVSTLEARDVEYTVVDDSLQLRPWNFLSYIVNGLISRGVPSSTILLVLMLPIIATVVAFMKQVVGLNTLGVYTPSILSLSFIALNFTFGLVIFLFLFAVAILTRHVLHRYRLLYVPRMAIILSISSFAILALFYLGSFFPGRIDELAIFPILILTTLVEKFVTIQGEKGVKGALHIGMEILIVAVLCYFVAQWSALEVLVLGHPEFVLLFVLFDFILARWSGLRLTEYVRFRELIRHVEE